MKPHEKKSLPVLGEVSRQVREPIERIFREPWIMGGPSPPLHGPHEVFMGYTEAVDFILDETEAVAKMQPEATIAANELARSIRAAAASS
jgi:hypothetical protein